MDTPTWASASVTAAALGPSVLYVTGAFTARRGDAFRGAVPLAGGALALALAVLVGRCLGVAPVAAGWLRLDAVGAAMLPLVTLLGLVIVRFSRTALAGEPGLQRYVRSLFAALAAVSVLVTTRHLGVLAAAGTATSLALHPLLTFYAARTAAQVAAHKKFLVSRLADACLVGALLLVRAHVGSLDLDALDAWCAAHPSMPTAMHVAAALLVAGAALKSAQLPFHGWLAQVMEAPTPVSALLHAGVVNLGGLLLLRTAPLVARSPGAQGLLLAVSLGTTVAAALVMTTRVSVKVALAWSTCAQMGMMLVQCALGAWHLALLHLVAHSLYKAHAFLSAGRAVDDWRVRALSARPRPVHPARVGAAALATLAVLAAALRATGSHDVFAAPLAVVLALSLAPSLARSPSLPSVLRAAVVTALYLAGHAAARKLVSLPVGDAAGARSIVVAGALGLLFAAQTWLQWRPAGALAAVLHGPLFAGLHLDELFTRWTFWCWPLRLPKRSAVGGGAALVGAQEA